MLNNMESANLRTVKHNSLTHSKMCTEHVSSELGVNQNNFHDSILIHDNIVMITVTTVQNQKLLSHAMARSETLSSCDSTFHHNAQYYKTKKIALKYKKTFKMCN